MCNPNPTQIQSFAEVLSHFLQSQPEITVKIPLKNGEDSATMSITYQSKQWTEGVVNDFRNSRVELLDEFLHRAKSESLDTTTVSDMLSHIREIEIKLLQVAQQIPQHDNLIVPEVPPREKPVTGDDMFNLDGKDAHYCYELICAVQRAEMFFLKFLLIFSEMVTSGEPLSAEALQEIKKINLLSNEQRNAEFSYIINSLICYARHEGKFTREGVLADVDVSTLNLYSPSMQEKIKQLQQDLTNITSTNR